MKYEWKKVERHLYQPKKEPELVTVPKQKFFTIHGEGNPNHEDFSQRVEALYTLSYAIRMMPKQKIIPEGYFEYTVYPLEGVWDLTDEAKKTGIFSKDELLYTIMIRQPEFVTDEVVQQAFEIVRKKKKLSLIDEISFEMIEDGLSVQILHLGSYDNESESFAKMNQFIADHQLQLITKKHREIYLNDPRKTKEDKLKTILRYQVTKKNN